MTFSTPSSADANVWAPGAGIFVGYSFGKSNGLQVGLETFAIGRVGSAHYQQCGERWNGAAFGPLAQLSIVGGFNPQLTVAGTGLYYGEKNFPTVWGEAGVSYLFREGRFGIHSGLLGPTAPAHLNLHHEWLANSTFVGVGARTIPYLQEDGSCSPVEPGRPLRTDKAARGSAASECIRTWSTVPAARAWQRQARGELESVPAFLNLAIQLLAVGAPDELVERTLRAAEEEMEHARLCIHQAKEADPMVDVPLLVSNWSRAPLFGNDGLVRLAVESWLDGIVNEGASALSSEAALSTLGSHPSRKPLQRLAREERSHLELARDVLTYAISQSSQARAAVEALGNERHSEAFYAPTEEVEGFAPAEMRTDLARAHAKLMASVWARAGLEERRLKVS